MVHTLEIIKQINIDEANALIEAFDVSPSSTRHLLYDNEQYSITKIHISRCRPELGIKCLLLIRYFNTANTDYYAVLRIEPRIMLAGERTTSLFYCSSENVDLLATRFREIISEIFPNICSHMAVLASWNCRRIDYSVNLFFDEESLIQLFLDQSKKTSLYIRKKAKRIKGIKLTNQSTAEGNKSVKVTVYGKKSQINQCYNDIPLSEQRRLEEAASRIVRFEVQCKKIKILTIKRKYNFADRSIVNYLQEKIADPLLLTEYDNMIGKGNFYSLYHAKKIIEASDLSRYKKQKLILLLKLIARTRQVSVAKERFMEGTTVRFNHRDIPLRGCANTFRTYIRDLSKLGINPVLIPKEAHITMLKNPRIQIVFPLFRYNRV